MTERSRSGLKKGDLALMLDRTGAHPVAVVRIELITALYVYWRVVEAAHPEYRTDQQGRTFKHLNLVVAGDHVPEARSPEDAFLGLGAF